MNTTKIAAILVTIILGVLAYLGVYHEIFAWNNDNVTICHKTGNGWVKITVDDDAVNGSGNGDHNTSQHQGGQDIIPPGYWDQNGRNWNPVGIGIWENNCSVPQITPSPTPTIEPTPTIVEPTPTIQPECEVECQKEPTPSPTPTLTPEPEVVEHHDDWNLGGAPIRECASIEFAPTILGFKRLSSTSIWVNWTETAPIQSYRVYYGLSKDNLVWNTTVENTHEVTLNGLPENRHIWVGIKGTDGVCEGESSQVLDP